MRKHIQQQLNQLIETLCEGIQFIIEHDSDVRVDIFNNCVEGINTIINVLNEQKFGQQREEDYNSILQQVFSNMEILRIKLINEESVINEGKSVCLGLSELYKEIQKEKVKLEIVFLPYKASMWDSMESVWRAAASDDRCECYVVPIPYYDKKPDGSLADMHYEGSKFPESIPIMDYNEYSLKNRHPDIIYIHNPYDEYNHVTSIHPYFYSYKIKNYTDMLVYIPYCISGVFENNQRDIKAAMAPAMRYVDRIIAQNENQRQLLISAGCDKDKVIALGTPKLDSVYYMQENPPHIWEDWNKVIKDRKVILLNLTLGTILQEEIWIDRYNYYINHIANRKEVAIIYRPHPLMEATLKSMRPHLYDKYMHFIENISSRENVIIDKFESADAAFWCSDAMISDYSSLPFKYIATGKPVYLFMINPKNYIMEENRFMESIKVFDFYDSYFWCLDKKLALEFKMKDVVGKYRCITRINSEHGIEYMEVDKFIDIVVQEKDFKKEERLNAMKNSVLNSDGTCGYKINQYIVELVMK